MGFIGNFLGSKVANAQISLTQLVVQFDPETATEAQIKTVADALGNINSRLAELQGNLEGAQKKVAADEESVHRNMSAAEILSKQGKDDKATMLLDEVQNDLNPRLESDKRDLQDIQASISEMESRRKELADKLRSARSTLENGRRDMERAKLEQQRAQEKEHQAKVDAGILKTTGELDVATNAMAQAAAKARQAAEASRLNAESLSSVAGRSGHDDDIKAALDQASGKAAAPQQSVADRLAAMKAQMGGKAA